MIQTDSLAAGWTRVLDMLGLEEGAVVEKAFEAGSIVVLAWIGLWIARRMARRFEERISEEEGDTKEMPVQRARTIAQITNSIVKAIVVVTATLLLLNLVFPIGPLLAGVGVFGLALSFGAQSLVKDIISGFFILTENQFAVGDVIEIDGTSGIVERISLRLVMLRDVEGVLHIIPNGSISKVSNRTRGWSRALLDVDVAYSTDVDRALDVLREMILEFAEDEEWKSFLLKAPEVLGVQELGESGVRLRMVVDTKPGRQWEVKRELRRWVKNRFDREGIVIPFPQRTVHVRPSERPDDLPPI